MAHPCARGPHAKSQRHERKGNFNERMGKKRSADRGEYSAEKARDDTVHRAKRARRDPASINHSGLHDSIIAETLQ